MADSPNPPKTMSSRLLTMKFMQRGSPSSSSPGTPSEPAYKRQRLSNGSSAASTPRSDAQRVAEALAAEERKRAEAIEREGADRGETKWYLSVQQSSRPAKSASALKFVSAGYSVLDAAEDVGPAESDEDEEGVNTRPLVQGRMNFGKFSRKPDTQQTPNPTSSSPPPSDSEDGEVDEDDEDDPTGVKAFIAQSRREAAEKARAGRQAKRKADESDGKRMADDRRKKQVRLNGARSISSGGGRR